MADKQQITDFYSKHIYDDAFRTMESKCDDILIFLINHMFGENFGKRAEINRLRNEQFIEHKDKKTEKRITDSTFEIRFEDICKRYHLECESKPYDGTILVRIFEYDSQIARTDHTRSLYEARFKFPNSGLLLLRKRRNVPANAHIVLEMPDGKETFYEIPILKMWDFTIEFIFDKKLYMLIPFFMFNYESRLNDINQNRGKVSELMEIYEEIFERLKVEQEKGNLSALSYSVIINMTYKVAYKLTKKHKNIQEKAGEVMGGQVIDLPEFRIYDEGMAKGISKGIRIFIEDKIEDDVPENIIIEKLKHKYELTEDKAREWIKQCRATKE